MGLYDRPRLLGCKPVDGVLVVLCSDQLNISTIVHQMGDLLVSHLVNKNGIIYMIWTKNNQYAIYWFTSNILGLPYWPKFFNWLLPKLLTSCYLI